MNTKQPMPRPERNRPGSKPIVDEHDHAGAVTHPEHDEAERRQKLPPKKRPRRVREARPSIGRRSLK
jgi:hypothetical protein